METSFVVHHVFKKTNHCTVRSSKNDVERSADRKRESVGEDWVSRVYRAESDRLLWCDELTDKETKRGMK